MRTQYNVGTKYGRIGIVFPFECQKCGKCCQSPALPFKCPRLTNDNLCTTYDQRPDMCRVFPFAYDFLYSAPMKIKCPAFLDWLKIRNTVLIGYYNYVGYRVLELQDPYEEIAKIPSELVEHLKVKLTKRGVPKELIDLFEKVNAK